MTTISVEGGGWGGLPGEGGGALPGGKGGGWGDSIDVAAAVSNWQKTHITARSRATPCAGEGEERQEFGSLTASDGGGCQSTLAGVAVGTTPRGRMMGSGHVADGSGPASPVGKRGRRDAALTGHHGFAACAAAPSKVWNGEVRQGRPPEPWPCATADQNKKLVNPVRGSNPTESEVCCALVRG